MSYNIPTKSKIAFVALKITNINQMVDFYTKVIGLSLLKRTEDEAYLGMPSIDKVFITLKRIDAPYDQSNISNMKAFSLILPDEDNFKMILMHIKSLGIKMSKVQSDNYYDSIHLYDPESNQITLCIKKFDSSSSNYNDIDWFNIESKEIGVSKYLNGYTEKCQKLPKSTQFGWLKLYVSNLKNSLKFYHEQLGFKCNLDSTNDKAVLTNNDDYQQQFILYEDSKLKQRISNMVGLDYLDIKILKIKDIRNLYKHLQNMDVDAQFSETHNFIFVSDPDGINVIFSLL